MPRPRSENARQSVLAAMRRALAADGYDAVTIEGLAAAAGVSKQTIYRWWPSKAAILGEALLEGSLPGADVALPFSDDLTADLRGWFTLAGENLSRPENVALARALIAVTATDPERGAALNHRFADPVVSWIVARVTRAQEEGDVRPDVDAAAVADQFLAATSYSALLGRPLTAARVDALVELVTQGIAARPLGR
ncbi:TetR/AcrR family transcriptional regulator [Microbacterium azadirachtae]|uniref:TetR/AcrR family transcriptional regulator n=1 Tax=Microbacterium azadirachtae TaxID=582680 RepID=UPI00088DF468|nr:TetR/AcrR family transcriptional regulator [Microbacterium azadirachtae]SDL61605.1 DNA-binding transcriptional regulator, AcrR family [Microbacterium azadirachtae]SEF90527.1 DNA-binding transcriptional regulator, AcrR family [Microbacterium azadirachtae]SEF92413.1 DNA-binding transcriptional regulator, AcrR family [Microbacterium azadirachtae]